METLKYLDLGSLIQIIEENHLTKDVDGVIIHALKAIKQNLDNQAIEIKKLKTKNGKVDGIEYKKYFISLWAEGNRVIKFNGVFTSFTEARKWFESFDLSKYPNGVELRIEEVK